MTLSILYFAYGSNMHSPRLRERVGAVRIVGAVVANNYVHRFDKHGSDGSAKGNIHPSKGERAHGVLYDLTSAQLVLLRTFEGGYREGAIEVAANSQIFRAVTFFGVRLNDTLQPSVEYLNHYQRGIAEHGIPPSYYDKLLRHQ